ncbi:hypothetical protein [Euzebya sp.]|uniref:hypothetical protein n=1 Tax=Euzebya sp. TaxID=1971409 RepID=UPI0035133CBE
MATTDAHLRVVGSARRSLFDAVRPTEVQAAGERLRGPGGMALAALHHDGVAGGVHAPADAVVLAGRAVGRARDGWVRADETAALGIAYGIAVTRHRRTAGGRTWCLLRLGALQHGRTLETAAVLADLPAVRLTPIVVGPSSAAERTAGLLTACGLSVHAADNDDAWSVLSALDHASAAAEHTAAVVLATREDPVRHG